MVKNIKGISKIIGFVKNESFKMSCEVLKSRDNNNSRINTLNIFKEVKLFIRQFSLKIICF